MAFVSHFPTAMRKVINIFVFPPVDIEEFTQNCLQGNVDKLICWMIKLLRE